MQKGGSDAYEWTYSGSGTANTYTDNISGRKYIYTYDSLGRIIRVAGEDTASGDFYSSSDYVYDMKQEGNQLFVTFKANRFAKGITIRFQDNANYVFSDNYFD